VSEGDSRTEARGAFVTQATFVASLLNSAPLGILVLDADLRCIAANQTLLDLSVQHAADDRDDDSTLVLLAAEFNSTVSDAPALASALKECLDGQVVVLDAQNPPVLGLGLGQWAIHLLPFVVGTQRGVAMLFEDCTEQRITSEAFQAAEQRFRMLVDAAADGIVIYRAQILLYVNPEAVRLLGFDSPDELVGKPLNDLIDREHRTSFDAYLNDLELSHSSGVFESAFVHRTGEAFPVECRASHTRVDDMGAGFLFFRNIADRKRQQARRENARRVESLARLCMSVGTELQTYATRLRRLVPRAYDATQNQASVLSEVSQLAIEMHERGSQLSLQGPTAPRDSEATSLEELLGRVCSAFFAESGTLSPPNEPSRVSANSDVLIDLEPVEFAVRGDASTIEASLTSLARAAWRSRSDGAPLRIQGKKASQSTRGGKPGYHLTLTGASTKRQLSSKQGKSSTFPPNASTFGSWELGRDLELLGAFSALQSQGCWVETSHSSGNTLTFEVELLLDPNRTVAFEVLEPSSGDIRQDATPTGPRGTASAPSANQLQEVDSPPDTERSHSATSQHLTRSKSPVLICDDEARLVSLTAGLLREFGFDVLTVRSGAEAIGVVELHPVDVVILDINLPGEDAREILIAMQSKRSIAVVLSSGYTEEDVDPLLLQEPAVKAFLSKPYTVDVLVQTIDRVRADAGAAT